MIRAISFLSILLLSYVLIAQTNVNGGIFSNTTWTKANSPYTVTGSVVVFPNVSLTIEPGVEVKFDSTTFLEIRQGKLFAIGTAADSIYFISSKGNVYYGWEGLKLNSCEVHIEHVQIRSALEGIERFGIASTGEIKNSTFIQNDNGISSLTGKRLDSCYFIRNYNSGVNYSEQTRYYNCQFIDNAHTGLQSDYTTDVFSSYFCGNSFIGLYDADTIKNCVFVKNGNGSPSDGYGLARGHQIIECLFAYNDVGIGLHDTLIDCDIFNNRIGIVTRNAYQIIGNNICNNTEFNAVNGTGSTINLSNICWCETDSSLIASKIKDAHIDVALGLVDFIPFNACNSSVLPPNPDTLCLATLDTSTGSASLSANKTVLTYPNPTSELLYIEGIDYSVFNHIEVYNSNGIPLYSLTLSKKNDLTIINVSNWGKGLFLVKLVGQDPNISIAKKVLVQ